MLYRLARAGFFQLDAEKAHDLAITNFQRLNNTPLNLLYRQDIPNRSVECMGLTFRNPVGLAAGCGERILGSVPKLLLPCIPARDSRPRQGR